MINLCSPKLYRKRAVYGKLQTVCNEQVELLDTDGGIRVAVGQTADAEVDMYERDIARSTLTPLPDVPGAVVGTMSFSSELTGSGDITVAPEHDVYLKACGMSRTDLQVIEMDLTVDLAYGDVINQPAETPGPITATGIVYKDVKAGTAVKVFVSTADTFAVSTETFKGDVSVGDTTATAQAAGGFAYTPDSDSTNNITLMSFEDGYAKTIYGATGTWSYSADSSKPAIIEFTFNGVVSQDYSFTLAPYAGTEIPKGEQLTDGAGKVIELLRPLKVGEQEVLYARISGGAIVATDVMTGATGAATALTNEFNAGFGTRLAPTDAAGNVSEPTYFSTLPPVLQDARLKIGDFSPIFGNVSVDIANDAVVRVDGNSRNGLVAGYITNRMPTASVDPEMIDSTDIDLYRGWFEGQVGTFQHRIGKSDGNTIDLYSQGAQYSSLSDGERDGVATVTAEMKLVGTDDDELVLVFT